jgi:hypothetical protein
MSNLQSTAVVDEAQKSFIEYISASVRDEVGDLNLESPETVVHHFSISEEYKIESKAEYATHIGVVNKEQRDDAFQDNDKLFQKAYSELLHADRNSEEVYAHCVARIKSYTYLENAKATGALELYRNPKRLFNYQGCQSCAKTGSLYCMLCNDRGQVLCSVCAGDGKTRCGSCFGQAKYLRRDPVYRNGEVAYYDERWENCGGCSGEGFFRCHYCLQTGRVNCSGCGGTKSVKCGPCAGTGWFTQIGQSLIIATQSVFVLYQNMLDELAITDLGLFLKRTRWDVREEAVALGIDYEVNKVVAVDGVVKVNHQFEAPRTCYYVTLNGTRSHIRHFGSRHLLLDTGGVLEQLVSAELDALLLARDSCKSIFSPNLALLRPALINFLEVPIHWQVVAIVVYHSPSPSVESIADTLNRSLSLKHIKAAIYGLCSTMKLFRRRRQAIGAAAIIVGTVVPLFVAIKLGCANWGPFIGNGCLYPSAGQASQAAFPITPVLFGLVVGALVARWQFLAEKTYFRNLKEYWWDDLIKFAKKTKSAHGKGTTIACLFLGGLVAYGAVNFFQR